MKRNRALLLSALSYFPFPELKTKENKSLIVSVSFSLPRHLQSVKVSRSLLHTHLHPNQACSPLSPLCKCSFGSLSSASKLNHKPLCLLLLSSTAFRLAPLYKPPFSHAFPPIYVLIVRGNFTATSFFSFTRV